MMYRRFRFSLRTLLVVVALFAVWMGYQMKEARERQHFVTTLQADKDVDDFIKSQAYKNIKPKYEVSWVRKMFGDDSYGAIGVPHESSVSFVKQTQELFPEAFIFRVYSSGAEQVVWLPAPIRHSYIDFSKYRWGIIESGRQRMDFYWHVRRDVQRMLKIFGLALPSDAQAF
jgi:hypothetical protein